MGSTQSKLWWASCICLSRVMGLSSTSPDSQALLATGVAAAAVMEVVELVAEQAREAAWVMGFSAMEAPVVVVLRVV